MYQGDFAVAATVVVRFNTADASGAPITLAGTPAISVYKNSTTQSTTGVTLTVDYDGVTGLHSVAIDTSADGTFYAAGNTFDVVITTGTVNGVSAVGIAVGAFSLAQRTIASMAAGTITAAAIAADAITDAKVASDVTIASVTGAVGSVTGAVGSVTGNVGGNVTGSVGSVATGGIAAASFAAGAINAAAIASDAITAAKIADGAIDAATFATGAITAAAIAADAIGASELAADAVTEIQSGLATAAALATVDTVVDAIQAKTDNLPSDPADQSLIIAATDAVMARLGAPAGASMSADIAAIEAQTDDIGVAGAGLSAVPWNAAWDAEVQSEAADALAAYDPPTRAEVTSDKDEIVAYLAGLVQAKGTIGSTGNSTTALHLDGLTYGDNEINYYLLAIKDVSTGEWHARYIEDWADTGDIATVATLPFTPQNATDLYVLFAIRADVVGGSGLDAAGVRAAVGLASANLDTQLGDLPTNSELTAALAAADDAVLTRLGTPAGASVSADIAAVKVDSAAIKLRTDNLPSDPADASDVAAAFAVLQGELDGIQADTEDIQSRLPAALTGAGNIKADAVAVSGDATAADTLELFVEALDQSTGQVDNGSFAAGARA